MGDSKKATVKKTPVKPTDDQTPDPEDLPDGGNQQEVQQGPREDDS